MLLHGWIASGGLNWFQVFEPLSRHFNLVAPDMRGHGRGIRSGRRFRLGDCADDAAAVCDQLGIDRVIAVGYSLGGPVAQLLWRQHPERVEGLVLAATAQAMVPVLYQRMLFNTAMMAAAGTTRAGQIVTKLPRSVAKAVLPLGSDPKRPETLQRWVAAEMRRHSTRMVLEAGFASGSFNSSRWLKDIDVPTVVLITTKDRAMSPMLQARLAFGIPGASIHRVDDGHLVCVSPAFAEPVLRACLEVAHRARVRESAA
jgi:pimeloyl-ACP methyl ester carboxylesterase